MVKFIVDSTFGLSRVYAAKNDVAKVNLTVLLHGKEYPEGFSEEWEEFYTEYAGGKSAATTSQPSPRAFMDAIDGIYEKPENDGADVIILTIGDRLSGSVGSANIASLQYPTRRIGVIDTSCAAVSAFLFLDEMIKAEKAGKNFDELMAYGDELKKRISIKFIPSSLTELNRGGRVGKALTRIGTILNIRPIFSFAQNKVDVLSKHIGIKSAVNSAVSKLPENIERIALCYIYDDSNVQVLKDRLQAVRGLSDVDVYPVSPVLGAHIGVGTVGVATLEKA